MSSCETHHLPGWVSLRSTHPTYLQPEHVKHRGVPLLLELRRVDESRFARGARPRRNRHVLFAADLEGHGRCGEAGADIDLPKLRKRGVVIGCDRAIEQRG